MMASHQDLHGVYAVTQEFCSRCDVRLVVSAAGC